MSENNYWKDFKNLFKSKQRLQEEESQAVGDAVAKEDEIVKKLKELEERYKATLTEDTPDFDAVFQPVTLERVSYDVDNDDVIKSKAEKEAEAKYAGKISSVTADALEKIAAAENAKQSAESEKKATLAEIENLFSALSEKAKNDSVKKGVSRSSILENRLDSYGDMKTAGSAEAQKNYGDTLKNLDDKISTLNSERDTALTNLDLMKAAEITSSIDSLTAAREKKLAEEKTKNNTVEKQEAELNAKLQKEKEKYISDYYKDKAEREERQAEEEKKNGYVGEKQSNYAERYNLALQFYLSLDPDIAPKALEASGNMKYYLGNYYDKLKDVLTERNSQSRTYI